jgi:hypothetical protein
MSDDTQKKYSLVSENEMQERRMIMLGKRSLDLIGFKKGSYEK